ncbi:MAG: transposase [bacterium]|nr:transposase [bacterium]
MDANPHNRIPVFYGSLQLINKIRSGEVEVHAQRQWPPFGPRGLTRMDVWILRLGNRPIFVELGRPDQDGRHERFHETLKAETASPPRISIRAQQDTFDRSRSHHNEERPHEALAMKTPSDLYGELPRSMPAELPDDEYPESCLPRRVRRDGSIKWQSGYFSLAKQLLVRW